ncbi:hypothetical protein GUJ93_ZPchr0014g47662 [Zizania palustris]|uniref:BHLH domain-containing protein n=1 Tax=Zizania palustris TaxID=103762 RepID=A0A8J5VSG0_ZIZPA|nr:hypothetical protein GUJ93_ZPchr0014g47662 [Zizania palustris]
MPVATAEGDQKPQGRRKRRRRARSCKSREDAENQRMTHIAVERNRRRQMNEYLAVLRSLMPESYVHRGDQASIVGGAIDFVKELEQLLQSLEAQQRTLLMQSPPSLSRRQQVVQREAKHDETTTRTRTPAGAADQEEEEEAADGPPFARFFTYPQYVWRHQPRDGGAAENRAGVADIEVSLVETHASLRVMAPRRPGQLLKMVAGLQALRLTVLTSTSPRSARWRSTPSASRYVPCMNTTSAARIAIVTAAVEEECGMATVDDIAAAVHHVLCIIDAEAAGVAAAAAARRRRGCAFRIISCLARYSPAKAQVSTAGAELDV